MSERKRREQTIGEAYQETKKLERSGILRVRVERLIKQQEKRFGITHYGRPELAIGIEYPFSYREGVIYLQYWDPRAIKHELGHFYLDTIRKRVGLDYYRPAVDKALLWQTARHILITEGVAESFQVGEKDQIFEDFEYPNKIDEFLNNKFGVMQRLYYSGGLHLVKPILERFGIEQGCIHLNVYPPTETEMASLPQYRQRILSLTN